MEVIGSYEMSADIRTTRRYVPEDANIHVAVFQCQFTSKVITLKISKRRAKAGPVTGREGL
jgi:hypothetical protein